MLVTSRCEEIERCQNEIELDNFMGSAAQDYGFASYNFLDFADPLSGSAYFIGTVDQRWRETYQGNDFAHVDSCLSLARRRGTPFTWTDGAPPHEVFAKAAVRGRKPGVVRLYEAAKDFRYSNGLVVPYHFRDDIGRPCSTLMQFIWADDHRQFPKLLAEKRVELHFVAIYWMQKFVGLRLQRARRDEAPRFASSLMLQPANLTDREREVLTWASRGKSTSETATILGIASHTVVTHLRSSFDKLNVRTKIQAVTRAIYLGLLDP